MNPDYHSGIDEAKEEQLETIKHVAIISRKQHMIDWQQEFGSEVNILDVDVKPTEQNYFAQEYFVATILFEATPDFRFWDSLGKHNDLSDNNIMKDGLEHLA